MHINEKGMLVLDDGESSAHPILFKASPNRSQGLRPEDVLFIVAHWTGGSSLNSAMGWLTNPQAQASAHFIIGRDGQIAQLVTTDDVAWHAGTSSWTVREIKYEKINKWSIGIEFVNLGKLRRTEAGTFVSSTGRVVPNDEVLAVDGGAHGFYQVFPHDQLMAGLSVMSALKARFPSIESILGHNDVAPTRKIDPGPMFPMAWYHAKLFGGRA